MIETESEPALLQRDRRATRLHRVTSATSVAGDVLELVLSPQDGSAVVPWTPGSHIDLVLPSGLERQYSLCGPFCSTASYTIAVLRESPGRGGSAEAHNLDVGSIVGVKGPRNNFPLVEAPSYLFLAGGIGITPIIPMIEDLARRGHEDWRLVYGGRSGNSMAYSRELASQFPGNVTLCPEESEGRLNFTTILRGIEKGAIYACGPSAMLDALASAHAQISGPQLSLRTEQFGIRTSGARSEATLKCDTDLIPDSDGVQFEIELRRSGKVLTVPPDRTILDVVLDEVPNVPYGCLQGFCGGCETTVLAGIPDHRDDFLTDEERKSNRTMLICVGRAHSPRLTLDI